MNNEELVEDKKDISLASNNENGGDNNEYELEAVYKILEIIANDPLLALLTDLKIKVQTGNANEEDSELLYAIEKQLDNFIKGEVKENEVAKKEVNEINNQSPEEHINNMVRQVANLFFETHTPKEGFEELKDFIVSSDRDKHIKDAQQDLGEGAEDLEVIKSALARFKPKKTTEIQEDEVIGKTLNPSNKPKPKKRNLDLSKMGPKEYQEYINKILEENK